MINFKLKKNVSKATKNCQQFLHCWSKLHISVINLFLCFNIKEMIKHFIKGGVFEVLRQYYSHECGYILDENNQNGNNKVQSYIRP